MKKYIFGFCLSLSILLGVNIASAATVYVDQAAVGVGDGTSLFNAFTTIQAAISSATTTNGDTISIADGIYSISAMLDVSKELTLQGTTQTGTIIDASAIVGNYGISSNKSNLTFSNFTLIGPAVISGTSFGLKLSGNTSNSPVYTQNGVRSTNISISNVTVKDSGRTGIDLNGVNNVTLTSVTLQNNKGNGLSLTDGDNLILNNVNTTGNTWGGVAIYTRGQYYPGGVSGVTVNSLNSTEANPLYSQLSNPAAQPSYPITGIVAPQFPFIGTNSSNIVGANYVFYGNDPVVLSGITNNVGIAASTTIKKGSINVFLGSKTIQDLIDAATAGDTINNLNGIYIATTTINVNKRVTLKGINNTEIIISGTNQIFLITAAGSTIEDLKITKSDKTGTQNIIGIQAATTTIRNNTFVGQYVLGDAEVARAIEVSPGVDTFVISGNNVTGLRQPAYINNATGTVSNNYVGGTRGWVTVADSNVTFTGNTWGTNFLDIVIIASSPTTLINNYSNIPAIKSANNNANIENQPFPYVAPVVVVPPVVVSGGGSGSLILVPSVTNSNLNNVIPVTVANINTAPVVSSNQLQVLGASTFKFTKNLGFGMRNNDVIELHKVLIGQGNLRIKSPTGYFGPLTRQAVKKWQAKNINLSTGFFGPISREFINR